MYIPDRPKLVVEKLSLLGYLRPAKREQSADLLMARIV